MVSYAALFCSVFSAYLVGSLPLGYWFAKLFYGLDVTNGGPMKSAKKKQ